MDEVLLDARVVTFKSPDDWHLHLRDGDMLPLTVTCANQQCRRALIMPNTVPPITTVERAMEYRARIVEHLPEGVLFEPLMTLFMTDETTSNMILEAQLSGIVYGVKLYPAGATTNSASGVTNLENMYPVFNTMQEVGLPLLFHGEVPGDVDIFDREAIFIDTILRPIVVRFPSLKVVLEHVSTKHGVEFIQQSPPNVVGTITAHHMLYSRSSLFAGGLNPHLYCLPVLKTDLDRLALLAAATSGSKQFFLGSDSAPHVQSSKECAHCAAGVFSGACLIELYLEAFDSVDALDMFEGFASIHGASFYGIAANQSTVSYTSNQKLVPTEYVINQDSSNIVRVIPLRAGGLVNWTRSA